MRKGWRDQRGSQIVEFALIAPILCFLVLAAPVLGMAVRAWLVVEAAAREGARTVAITQNVAAGLQRACDEVEVVGQLKKQMQGTTLFACDASFVNVAYDPANRVTVTVTYRQPTYIPGLGLLLGASEFDNVFVVTGRASYVPENRG